MDRIAQAPAEERTDLFQRAAAEIQPQRAPAIIEKDFWVCWTLRRIFEVLRFQPRLIFKGGTSLSKAYNAIERFSEDVDLSLSRTDLGFADENDPEQRV
jgi:predicted nucleotidyltransferase component of viral defense system